MTRDKSHPKRPAGHVLVPASAIGGMSVVLVAGLQVLGMLDRVNGSIARMVSAAAPQFDPKHLPGWCLWLAVVGFAFALSFAILSTPGQWRRIVLWITAVVVVAAWAPVLSLAAHAPEISAPWIATFWSGVCALFYASNHEMEVDRPASPSAR